MDILKAHSREHPGCEGNYFFLPFSPPTPMLVGEGRGRKQTFQQVKPFNLQVLIDII